MHNDSTLPPEAPNPLALKFPDLKPVLDVLGFMDGPFEDVPAGKSAASLISEAGDTKHIWDRRNEVEVDAMRALFKRLTRKPSEGGAGYRAFYAMGKDGERGEPMDEFDPNAERMIFLPPFQGG